MKPQPRSDREIAESGRTHFFGDQCGEKEHNQSQPEGWDELNDTVNEIIHCAEAWAHDDGVMAMNNEKTPEDILATEIKRARAEGRQEGRANLVKEMGEYMRGKNAK